MDYQANISRFVSAAREFCGWVEGNAGPNEVFDATRLISRLHAEAVMLPEVDDEHLPEDDDIPEIPRVQKQATVERFKAFPFQYYWEIFTPITDKPEAPVCGDAAD